jgi:cation transport regulator ChaC
MSRFAVFAYGSLVSPVSAASTLGREVEASGPVRLRGWRRRWSQARDNLAAEKTFARGDDGSLPRWCLGLNVEESPDDRGPNGVLLRLAPGELDRLDLREMRYDRVEVTDRIDEAVARGARVFTYTAKPRQLATTPPEGAVVISSYVAAVEGAFAALGDAELALYHETTDAPPVPVIDAVLVRDRIPAGNPRAW